MDDGGDEKLQAAEAALAEGDWGRLEASLRGLPPRHPRVLLLEGLLRWERHGPQEALAPLREAVAATPEDADTAHTLATALDALGHLEEATALFLRVLALDRAGEREGGEATDEELDLIERVAVNVLERLPDPFRQPLGEVPIFLDGLPSTDLVEEGFDPRALGLFEGPRASDVAVSGELPARIVLYTTNLIAAFPDPDVLAAQVEITVLHEVGHYFGLEEHDMDRLGLA